MVLFTYNTLPRHSQHTTINPTLIWRKLNGLQSMELCSMFTENVISGATLYCWSRYIAYRCITLLRLVSLFNLCSLIIYDDSGENNFHCCYLQVPLSVKTDFSQYQVKLNQSLHTCCTKSSWRILFFSRYRKTKKF